VLDVTQQFLWGVVPSGDVLDKTPHKTFVFIPVDNKSRNFRMTQRMDRCHASLAANQVIWLSGVAQSAHAHGDGSLQPHGCDAVNDALMLSLCADTGIQDPYAVQCHVDD
jgi:hypothetical protein